MQSLGMGAYIASNNVLHKRGSDCTIIQECIRETNTITECYYVAMTKETLA